MSKSESSLSGHVHTVLFASLVWQHNLLHQMLVACPVVLMLTDRARLQQEIPLPEACTPCPPSLYCTDPVRGAGPEHRNNLVSQALGAKGGTAALF